MPSSSTQTEPANPTIPEMVDAASSPTDRGSDSPTTAANTFAAAAHDDLTGVIGMGTGASRRATRAAWGGVSGGHPRDGRPYQAHARRQGASTTDGHTKRTRDAEGPPQPCTLIGWKGVVGKISFQDCRHVHRKGGTTNNKQPWPG